MNVPEREFSNSLWHVGWKRIDDGRWLICYMDNASRFVTGYDTFEHTTVENTLLVLDKAIKDHGRPASILTSHKKQFYASESEAEKNVASQFEMRLVELGIKQIFARANQSYTNNRLARLFSEVQRKLPAFEAIMQRVSDPVDLFMKWYNYDRPHMSLGKGGYETPHEAFNRKMPKEGTVIDESSGDEHHVK